MSVQAALFGAMPAFAEKAEEDKLQEITVTALKRTQTLQDVPVSIQTMSGEQLDEIFANGDDVLALSTRVPGLYAESTNGRGQPRFYLRGLGNTDFDVAASQPVSIIMDEVVQENAILKSFPIFDIENVEVIRGPQGTLFGRNTTAGIIKLNSRKPTEDFEAYTKVGYGTDGMMNLEGAVGTGLTEDLSFRASVLNRSKDDYVSNGYTGEKDVMGGFDEKAVRLQFAYAPTDNLDLLLNIHARDYEGTASLFRANILDQGSNDLNENYDRDQVWYDAGNNNPQEYKSNGWSLKADYDFGDFTLTSITSMESAEGKSLGDIDGGYITNSGESAPGFIPFGTVTQDAAEVDQFTQEIRIASNTSEQFSWQAGAFYYDSELDATTTPFFIDPSIVKQTNETWAVFGQGTYALNDKTTVIGGLRYTEDKKELTAKSGVGIPVEPVSLDDGQVSWEVMVNHKISDDISAYARAANGFRAQSIQGRDIAFFGQPSVADAETIVSYEAGIKADLMRDSLRLNFSTFHYKIEDIQLTAVGGNGNSVGLTNAGEGVGQGFEVDAEYRATQSLVFTAGFSYTDTELKDENLLIAPCGSGMCTPLDPIDPITGGAYVDGNPFPNAPETIFNLTARYSMEVGGSGEMYFFSDYAQQGKTNLFIYESEEYKTNNQFELGLRVGYIDFDHDYEVALFGRNITNEDNLKAGIDFNNNTGIVNEGASWGLEFKKSFY